VFPTAETVLILFQNKTSMASTIKTLPMRDAWILK
jgi:hypothetical protein